MDLSRDFAKLTDRLRNSKEVDVPLQTLRSEQEAFVYGLVSKALSYLGRAELDATLHLVIAELLANAEKAVLKKLFMKKKGIETVALSPEQQKEFATQLRDNPAELRTAARKLKSIAVFRANLSEERLEIKIENAGAPLPDEHDLIERRLELAPRYASLADLGKLDVRTEEGPGLGLLLAGLSLKQATGTAEALVYSVEKSITSFAVTIPAQPLDGTRLKEIEDSLLKEVESLPAFPEHLNRIMELCDSDTSDARQIAAEIEKDPAIAGQIIKLANSGGFAGGQVADVQEAVKIIGLKNISGLLLQAGAFKVLGERYNLSDEIIEHPVRVAVYSRQLARQYKLAGAADKAYAAGLLHDIGKMVFLAAIPDRQGFEQLLEGRDRRTQVNLEELHAGASHAIVGGLLARKWKFPDDLCSAIEFHHTPLQASNALRDVVFVVYLANVIADHQSGNMHYFAIEPEVLKLFNLTTDNAFEMLAASLSMAYSAG